MNNWNQIIRFRKLVKQEEKNGENFVRKFN